MLARERKLAPVQVRKTDLRMSEGAVVGVLALFRIAHEFLATRQALIVARTDDEQFALDPAHSKDAGVAVSLADQAADLLQGLRDRRRPVARGSHLYAQQLRQQVELALNPLGTFRTLLDRA